jgi:hypothetical protein
MKIITTNYRKQEQRFTIYENPQEFAESGLSCKHVIDAEIGDYILANNGFYIPVINIIPLTKGIRPCKKIYFPRYSIMAWQRKDNSWGYRNIIYPLSASNGEGPTRMTGKVKLFGSMIAKGYDFYDSFYKVFNTVNYNILDNIIQSDKFITYLEGLGYMDNLRKSFENKGITGEYIADKIIAILDEETHKDNVQLKKWALESAMNIINDKRPEITKNTFNIQQNDIDNFIGTSIPVSEPSHSVPLVEEVSAVSHE